MKENLTIPQWATYFYLGTVKDHQKILTEMLPYIEDPSYFIDPWIYSKCKSTCQSLRNKELPWNVFFEAIKPNLEEFFASLNPLCEYKISSDEVWLNLYERDGFQEIHDHAFPNRAFSCAYILELPKEKNSGGELVFENTNFPIIQSTGINRIFNAFNYEKFIPTLEEGMLIIFPSWVKHYVLPNRSDQRRVTISANFRLEGKY